jgi:hypothetical protein
LKLRNHLSVLPPIETPDDAALHFEHDELRVEMDRAEVGPFLTRLITKGLEIETISIHEPTLEDFFVHSARTAATNE